MSEDTVSGEPRDLLLDVSGKTAAFYPREYYAFDNFAAFQVEWRGQLWPTAEHAYQAAHFWDTAPELAKQICAARSPYVAYRLANDHTAQEDPDWSSKKLGIMEEIIRAKLQQHPYIRQKLLESRDLRIIEDSPKDSFWGWGPDRCGRNELGKLWMRLRDELRSGQAGSVGRASQKI
jgi:N-glycosidase YbiA